MSRLQQHLDQVARNEGAAALLLGDGNYPEWAVVTTFYAALHYVEAYLDFRWSVHSRDHWERNTIVFSDADLDPCKEEYWKLYNDSRVARYQPHVGFNLADAQLTYSTIYPIVSSTVRGLLPP